MIVNGDALRIPLADEGVDCCITSPPYWQLRDYGNGTRVGGDASCDHRKGNGAISRAKSTIGYAESTGHNLESWGDTCRKCGAVKQRDGIGLEPSLDQYIANLVAVFREVRRCLKPHGMAWVVLGDAYASQGGAKTEACYASAGTGNSGNRALKVGARTAPTGLKPKDLIGLPWRVAFALQGDGWYLRSAVVWAKGVSFCPTYSGSCMPESVKDRPTQSYEMCFLLTKNADYYYDNLAVRDGAQDWGQRDRTNLRNGTQDPKLKHGGLQDCDASETGRNLRSVWTINPQPQGATVLGDGSEVSHFAAFPEALVKPMILLSSSAKGVCPKCGKPWERVVEKPDMGKRPTRAAGCKTDTDDLHISNGWAGYPKSAGQAYQNWRDANPDVTTGWHPTCTHGLDAVPAVILDPFSGSGTTGLVAQGCGRKAILMDLSLPYCRMAQERIGGMF